MIGPAVLTMNGRLRIGPSVLPVRAWLGIRRTVLFIRGRLRIRPAVLPVCSCIPIKPTVLPVRGRLAQIRMKSIVVRREVVPLWVDDVLFKPRLRQLVRGLLCAVFSLEFLNIVWPPWLPAIVRIRTLPVRPAELLPPIGRAPLTPPGNTAFIVSIITLKTSCEEAAARIIVRLFLAWRLFLTQRRAPPRAPLSTWRRRSRMATAMANAAGRGTPWPAILHPISF
mmetsp:Transcript_26677/g.78807  ORF Transcript_26677/g.78807 Transcript_26677/m.78807 type:complete len:225 (+) Transcript_26677:1912-2586(+)